ncbi:MAG: hypothetical protein H6898_13150 [Rhodobacter sp.]|nr:hypothetical protein [Paracoccaceae bacterium]MCC0077504.1 hypothetical protein [Rhodobacter sp.]
MDLQATRDFKRPRAKVLASFRDPARFETVMRDMGAAAERAGEPDEPRWACQLMWRDEPRRFSAELVETVPNETMTLVMDSEIAGGLLTIDFYDLPDNGCRAIAKADLKPHTLIAKVAVQSLRLMRGKAEDRLTRFVGAMGRP